MGAVLGGARNDHDLSAQIGASLHRLGDRTALVAGGATLSGDQLLQRSLDFAGTLRARGLRPGDTVGVLVDRSIDSIVAILATLGVGGVYLPLTAAMPERWLRHLLALSSARLLVFPGELRTTAAVLEDLLPLEEVGRGQQAPLTPGTVPYGGGNRGTALAYVMPTSGTTGAPKAVPITQASLVHYCQAFADRIGGPAALAGLRMASVTTLAADLGNTMVFPALLFGGELHLVPERTTRDPLLLGRYLREHSIDALKVVPTHLRALLDGGLTEFPRRLLVVGGEPFGLDLLERLTAGSPECAVFNHYGPTEATIGVAMGRVETSPGSADRLRLAGHRSVPIGTALGATQLRVVDETLGLSAPGTIGELAIAGPAVASGYLGEPMRTRQRFTATSWSHGAAVFRSGDRARLWPDGQLELFGRTDRQFKIRGHRVEATGVEGQLRAHPGVNDAYVALRELGELGTALVAWVHAASDVGESELREFLGGRLPAPMVPSRFVVVDGLPRTGNGKIDPRALPSPPSGLPGRTGLGGSEDAVSQIFAEVLGLPREKVQENFFALGGHSLAALQVIRRLHDECGLALTMAEFYADPRPDAVVRTAKPADRLGRSEQPDPPTSTVSAQAHALWAHLQLNPWDRAYEIPVNLRIAGAVPAERIRAALQVIAQRHEVLRTRFIAVNGEPAPVVDATTDATLRFAEPGGHPESLDLAVGPIMRASITPSGHDGHLVDLLVHHIAFDGISTSVVVRDLAALLAEQPLPVAAVGRSKAHQPATRQHPALGSGPRARFGLPRHSAENSPVHCQEQSLPSGLWQRLEACAVDLNTTPFALVAAAWSLVLSRQDDESVVTVGTPADLRDDPSENHLVGYHVNVVVVEVEIDETDTVAGLVADVHRAVGLALADRNRPYAALVAEQRERTGTPPSRTLLTIERLERVQAGTIDIRQEPARTARPMSDLDVCIVVIDDAALLQLHHRESTCPEWRARCLCAQLSHVLEQFVADQAVPVATVSLLPESWARQVDGWSRGPEVRKLERWGALGFLDRAAESPDSPAVVWPGGQWTRAQLASRIEQTSRTLNELGLGPGKAVAVSVSPSPAAVVAWHAAQLVGAAVLALDPSWPAHRREAAIDVAEAAVLITAPDGVRPIVEGIARPSTPHSGDLAYLVMTSGTTGSPKVAAVQRSALVNELSWFAAEFPLSARDRVLAHTSTGFDVSVWEMLGPLSWGASLVFPEMSRRNDVPHLADLIRQHALTVLQTVPSLLDALLAEPEFAAPSLRLVVCGGEEMQPALASTVASRLPHADLVNAYGPTETAIDATFHRVEQPVRAGERVSIGRPIAGANAYVLDEHLRMLPPGAFGQLAIGGGAVGLGYLGNAGETRRRFRPDPFASDPGARLYLTGDRVAWTGDGRLEFGGRNDNQVKVRGNRIELEEVEAELRGIPGVDDAVVHLRDRGTQQARLVALVVPAKGTAPTVNELYDGARRTLPSYMVPSAFALVESLPRLSNGKVARNALPLEKLVTPSTRTGRQTPMEQRVSRVWAELLDASQLDRDLSFFASGGTSLQIPVLRLRLSQDVGAALSVPELFEYPTIRAQAALLEKKIGGLEQTTEDAESQEMNASGRGALRRRALAARRQRRDQ